MNKNIPGSKKESHNKKPSNSHLAKFTAGAGLIASLFATHPIFTQTNTPTLHPQQKNPLEFLEKNERTTKNTIHIDSIEHAKIITQDVQEILANYGPEKWLEIIREHVRVELNTIREKESLQQLNFNKKLTTIAQTYAKYLSDNNRFSHTDKSWVWYRKRIIHTWYPFEETWEIIATWMFTIQEFITMCIYSQKHLNQVKWTYFFDAGVGYYDGYRVVDFGGNK